jgi:rhodanese-related sulfurtransferase
MFTFVLELKIMKKLFIPLFCICLLFSSCLGQTSKAIKNSSVTIFEENLKSSENPQLLDVRTPQEFSSGHIKKATNINWNGSDFEVLTAKLDKTKPVFVYCKAGGRSTKASEKLAEMGFTTIYNLEGGVTKWTEEKLPLIVK